jgi:hypothetical protein
VAEGQFNVSQAPSSDEEHKSPTKPVRQTPDTKAEPVGSGQSTAWSRVTRPDIHDYFPWWPASLANASQADETCYHGNTRLADGRQGLLVDPGAWSNLAGEQWVQDMAKKFQIPMAVKDYDDDLTDEERETVAKLPTLRIYDDKNALVVEFLDDKVNAITQWLQTKFLTTTEDF